ncbi:hypothetical protein BD414DRAFT_499395 [Trametes punicea]|nr:hypothetical protein BD414DRAFT_499395 [Trametes punicea]
MIYILYHSPRTSRTSYSYRSISCWSERPASRCESVRSRWVRQGFTPATHPSWMSSFLHLPRQQPNVDSHVSVDEQHDATLRNHDGTQQLSSAISFRMPSCTCRVTTCYFLSLRPASPASSMTCVARHKALKYPSETEQVHPDQHVVRSCPRRRCTRQTGNCRSTFAEQDWDLPEFRGLCQTQICAALAKCGGALSQHIEQ